MSGSVVHKDNSAAEGLRRDVNAAIKRIMEELESASREAPEVAVHPYKLQDRRDVVVRTLWQLFRRVLKEAPRVRDEL